MAAKETLFLSVVGIYSLFPLLHPANLLFVKLTLFLGYVLVQFVTFRSLFNFRFNVLERIYCLGFGPLFLYTEILHHRIPVAALARLEFLPLLLTSVYCALGVFYFWLTVTFKFVAVRVGGGVTPQVTTATKSTTKTKSVLSKGKKEKKVAEEQVKNKKEIKSSKMTKTTTVVEKPKAQETKKTKRDNNKAKKSL